MLAWPTTISPTMDAHIFAILSGISGLLSLLFFLAYFFYSHSIQKAENAIRRTFEGEGVGLNPKQVTKTLQTFDKPETRIVALKVLVGTDDKTAKRLYHKIKHSGVDLEELTNRKVRTTLPIAIFFLLVALVFWCIMGANLFSRPVTHNIPAAGKKSDVSKFTENLTSLTGDINSLGNVLTSDDPRKDDEVQSILQWSSRFWEQARRIMRWDVFPQDYKALSEAIFINGLAVGLIYSLLILGIFCIAPIRFVAWHEWIANAGIPYNEKLAKILAPLLDSPHALNAVVQRYQQRALKLFTNAKEVQERPEWVPGPLAFGSELVHAYSRPPDLPSKQMYVAGLHEFKARLGQDDERWTISIEGPGGVGKSSLAFQMCRWASDSRPGYRLSSFPILPVLLTSLGGEVNKSVDEAAGDRLRFIMDTAKISNPLLQALLRSKRILILLDGVSETLKNVSDLRIRADTGAVNTRFLVVTSRIPTHLHESLVVRPQGLTTTFLDQVLNGLIAANVGAGRFDDTNREKLRARIRSLIEGAKERQVPMIFIKLMIERADQSLREGKQISELPVTLAELVTEYAEQLLRNEEDLPLALQQARMAAHICMGKERIPLERSEARYTSAVVAKDSLKKFVTAGLMVESGEKSDPFYKFALDPLAEQLDANRLVIDIREERVDRTELDDLAQRWEELPEDFVRALRRAAISYRQIICATQSAFSLKLWPPETKVNGLTDVEPLTQSRNLTSVQGPISGLEQGSPKPLAPSIVAPTIGQKPDLPAEPAPELFSTKSDDDLEGVRSGKVAPSNILLELHSSNGRIDARKIAEVLGVTLPQLCNGLKLNHIGVVKHPDSKSIQASLAPVKRNLEILYAVLRTPEAIRKWLNAQRPGFDTTPIEAILANNAEALKGMLDDI